MTHELGVLVDLEREAVRCESTGASEAHWNVAVHYPLLRMALKGLACEEYLKVWDMYVCIHQFFSDQLLGKPPRSRIRSLARAISKTTSSTSRSTRACFQELYIFGV